MQEKKKSLSLACVVISMNCSQVLPRLSLMRNEKLLLLFGVISFNVPLY